MEAKRKELHEQLKKVSDFKKVVIKSHGYKSALSLCDKEKMILTQLVDLDKIPDDYDIYLKTDI